MGALLAKRGHSHILSWKRLGSAPRRAVWCEDRAPRLPGAGLGGAVFGVAQKELGMLQHPSTAPAQAAGSRGYAGLGGGLVLGVAAPWFSCWGFPFSAEVLPGSGWASSTASPAPSWHVTLGSEGFPAQQEGG